MKFTVIKDIRQDPFMRPLLSFLVLFIAVYLISDLFVKQSSFGIFPTEVSATLFGNEEEFLDPITQPLFLEFWHVEIFFSMMILFTLSTVYIRVLKASKTSLVTVNIMMLSAIVTLISLPAAYYFTTSFVSIYTFSFLLWHITAVFASLDVLRRFYFAKSI